jgi:uncharacterized protein
MYASGDFVERVSPTPLLMLVANHDYITLTDLALKAYERSLEPKQLIMIKGWHSTHNVVDLATGCFRDGRQAA